VRYVLKNLVRDWSAEGALERAQSYGLLTQELKERFAGRYGLVNHSWLGPHMSICMSVVGGREVVVGLSV
jgi:hypothetical protein